MLGVTLFEFHAYVCLCSLPSCYHLSVAQTINILHCIPAHSILHSDPSLLSTWVAAALKHPIGKSFVSPRRSFLFLLIAEHSGFALDCDDGDDINEESSSLSFQSSHEEGSVIIENPMNIIRNLMKKQSSKRNKKEFPQGIGQFLFQELDLNSVFKNRVKCSTEMWDLVALVASFRSNQSLDFSRYTSRVGEQYQIENLLEHSETKSVKRKKPIEREIICTRKRKASTDAEETVKERSLLTSEHSSDNAQNSSSLPSTVPMESVGLKSVQNSVAWSEGNSFSPSCFFFTLESKKEKLIFERKRKRDHDHDEDSVTNESTLPQYVPLKKNVSSTSTLHESRSNIEEDMDVVIEREMTEILDKYLKRVLLVAAECLGPGSLIEAPCSYTSTSTSSAFENRNLSSSHASLNFAEKHRNGHKLMLCTVLRTFQLTHEESISRLWPGRTAEKEKGAALGAVEESIPKLKPAPSTIPVTVGAVSGSGPVQGVIVSRPGPVKWCLKTQSLIPDTTPVIKIDPLILSLQKAIPITSTSASAPSINLSEVPPLQTKTRAPSFSDDPADTTDAVPTAHAIRVRKVILNKTAGPTLLSLPVPASSSSSSSLSSTGSPSISHHHSTVDPAKGPRVSGSVKWVEVSNGAEGVTLSVPISHCRLISIGEDAALTALHNAHYCLETALSALKCKLLSSFSPPSSSSPVPVLSSPLSSPFPPAISTSSTHLPVPSTLLSSSSHDNILASIMPDEDSKGQIQVPTEVHALNPVLHQPTAKPAYEVKVNQGSESSLASVEDKDNFIDEGSQLWNSSDIALFIRARRR